jgi:capsular exopolysaccharide synthesis family protein
MIPLYQSFLNTQVSIIRNLAVLQRALDKQEVKETDWFKKPQKSPVQRLLGSPPDSDMERLRDALSVRPRPQTEIIDISFVASSAKDAKLIVNTVLERYITYTGEMSDATEDILYRQLSDQDRTLQGEIDTREKTCAALRKSLGTGTPEELISSRRVRLDATQARLSELRQNIAVLEWDRKQLEDLMKQGTTGDSNEATIARTSGMEKQPEYHEDAEWRRLDIDVRTERHSIDNSLLTPGHPDMIRVTNDLKFAEELLRLREAQLDEQWRNRPMRVPGMPVAVTGASSPGYEAEPASIDHQLTRAKQEEQLLRAELDKQQTEFQGLFDSAQLLEKENSALAQKRELFNAVRQRLEQKSMERNVPGSIDVLAWAFAPSRPYNDRRMVFTAMALVFGLGVGGGVACLRASRNQTIYAAKDMPHPMQVPFLGYIPLTRARRSLGRSLYDEVLQSQSRMIESVRVVRTALLSRLDGQGNTTVLVTSAAAGTGKSSFTRMLGKSLAQAGKKVLMIDADFRKMALTKRFDLLDKSGFMESLRSRSVDERFIFPTETTGLSIMPAGTQGDDGALFEETANGAFKTCIGELRKRYNIILLDSPPILPVADAAILSSQVDGTIMVERELVSRRSNVMNALARLGSAGGRLLGTVFVGSDDHEDYGYDYYYNRTGESQS